MNVLVGLFGLWIGHLLNMIIASQRSSSAHLPVAHADGLLGWVPIIGTLRRRRWLGLAVEVLSGLMALALFSRHGLGARSLLLYGGRWY